MTLAKKEWTNSRGWIYIDITGAADAPAEGR